MEIKINRDNDVFFFRNEIFLFDKSINDIERFKLQIYFDIRPIGWTHFFFKIINKSKWKMIVLFIIFI